ncbi:ABC transporter permease subunit [Methylorubrum populi]|jgi:putrescine transport system permease protein|uniref:Ornithine carbamoyltransferase n=2 Tax=Methylorubrum TaxID=2282523 RepID=B1ZIW5_METPB|nr:MULTISPECIES: ABC transporter permease subunit [Methylorubrum]ACB82804.1 Ornithine carbamoyltransferase [Methylorubrum populi BJ001]MBA8913385.1 putrescine transport system permease protein [Methylorubrum thiocyanatum]OAH26866.1 spermidine/putrescine ABC transporter permease [Methylorubrum populi]PZP68969.1 MAG: putrescine ABC transporter permease PotI [Methylorubrum populi]GJE80502.1 Inner membrane ABC transporter permease protein YdcV [Methylorubrum thiocyanatum]
MSLFARIALSLALAFLYVPIAVLVVYSFNASKLVTVWGGFSTQWYGVLFRDGPLIAAALVSLKVAALSATIAGVLGTCAALALDRHGRFRGRGAYTGLLYAPMVMPEVITGLSLLLLFVGIGLDRGIATLVIAHATFATGFVAVVVGARLKGLDRSLEEAAADLGAAPARVFFGITLPLIAPSVAAGFLLAFTLSLDDLVIASFVSGPGATTLPMRIYSQVRLGVNPEINAASTLLIAAVGLVVLTASWLTGRKGAAV